MALPDKINKHVWLKLLRGMAMSHGEYRVMVNMFTYTDAKGRGAHPGLVRIASDAGVTRNTARGALAMATEVGWLKLTRKGGNHVAKGLADEYELAIPKALLPLNGKGSTRDPLEEKGSVGDPLEEQELVDIATASESRRGQFEHPRGEEGVNLSTLKGSVGVPPSDQYIKSASSSDALHASDSSNRVDSARPSGPKQASSAKVGDQSLWDLGGAGPPCLQGYTWEDLQDDIELLEEWLDNWFGLDGWEPSTAAGMWESGSHPRVIWNKINADRRVA
ncbi:hypothetical protein H5392_01355 [Tessaracoccus sp. MC1865]|uniref:hypothetical protein n=1 Tax=Tessaracoccus sp. MC1865 TaxID=2760310 RepID=UPI0016019F16|nr:hypothetical protein [Tessaracoccus sp. MC1865]MBB1482504.1 hypothetical protein [Tessaracoccus sp. MC1865]QTO38041.1 hypothetical protein J7D54_02735 [Tessaracoccus sp. MC1865]